MKIHSLIFRLVLMCVITSIVGACTSISPNGSTPTLEPKNHIGDKVITSKTFLVSLSIPGTWEIVSGYEERYQGTDGYVSLGAKATESYASMQSVCEDEVNHVLQPFGADPTVQYMLIDGQEACVIFPSEDQNDTIENAAEIVVRYPFTLTINGSSFSFAFLQVFVTRGYASAIIPAIQFIR